MRVVTLTGLNLSEYLPKMGGNPPFLLRFLVLLKNPLCDALLRHLCQRLPRVSLINVKNKLFFQQRVFSFHFTCAAILYLKR